MKDRPVVLAIEDDPDDYLFLSRSIEKGAEFCLCRSETLAAGVDELASQSVDLVLLDLSLPDSRGLEAISTLSESSRTPIVVLTGYDNEEMAYKAVQMGAQDYLVKGAFDSILLTKTIRYAIERYRLVHELNESKLAIQREQEQSRLQSSIPTPVPTVTASSYGQYSLRESEPEKFRYFCKQYCSLLEGAVEQRVFKVDNDISQRLRTLATLFGKQRVVPRDVVEVHTLTLESVTKNTTAGKSDAYNEEGRYLLIGILGHLCSFYRGYCYSLLPFVHLDTDEADESFGRDDKHSGRPVK